MKIDRDLLYRPVGKIAYIAHAFSSSFGSSDASINRLVKISGFDKKIDIYSANTEASMRYTIDYDDNDKISFIVDAKELSSALKVMSGSVDLKLKNGKLIIGDGFSKVSIQTADEIIEYKEEGTDRQYVFNFNLLKILERTNQFTTSEESIYPTLKQTLFKVFNNNLYAIATNRYVLCKILVDENTSVKGSFLINNKMVVENSNSYLLKDGDGTTTIVGNGFRSTARNVFVGDGVRYPDIDGLLNLKNKNELILDREKTILFLKKSFDVIGKDSSVVTISTNGKSTDLLVKSFKISGKTMSARIETSATNDQLKVMFNTKLLYSVLLNTNSDDIIKLHYKDNFSMFVYDTDGVYMLIAPINME